MTILYCGALKKRPVNWPYRREPSIDYLIEGNLPVCVSAGLSEFPQILFRLMWKIRRSRRKIRIAWDRLCVKEEAYAV